MIQRSKRVLFHDFLQWTAYDRSRDTFYWLRMTNQRPGVSNLFRLSVVSSRDSSTFCNYDFTPGGVSSEWTGWWWDYAHMQIGGNYLYIRYAPNLLCARSIDWSIIRDGEEERKLTTAL